jgi:hypothetical protein
MKIYMTDRKVLQQKIEANNPGNAVKVLTDEKEAKARAYRTSCLGLLLGIS